MSDQLKLELAAFQGPFDLLLHLIKKLEVDINDIPMDELTAQYLHYVRSMQELQLDLVGDYLVMAATLLEIKSQLLLPIEPDLQVEEDFQGGDPRAQLVQQLLLYQQFQYIADDLEAKQASRAHRYGRSAIDLSNLQEKIPLEEGSLSLADLVKEMERVLIRWADRLPKERAIDSDPVTVDDKMNEIWQQLSSLPKNAKVTFASLVAIPSRPQIITTFMAVLELVRKQQLIFQQDQINGPIDIMLARGH